MFHMESSAFLTPLQVYLEAFAEVRPARRVELLTRCMIPEAEIWGPNRVFAGYEQISGKIAGFHANWPECRLVLTAGPNCFLNIARFGKAIVGPDGAIRASGHSVMEIAQDGRIARVVPFWEDLPPLPESWPEHLAASMPGPNRGAI